MKKKESNPSIVWEKQRKLALPDRFIQEMQTLFHEFDRASEWDAFLASFQEQPLGGLRANSQKIGIEALCSLLAEDLQIPREDFRRVPWSEDGIYYPGELHPGRLPHYLAGLYYIQEPSAMLPAAILAAQPGERILDLCAAPGGKTCRIAADLQGKGLIWANEINADRARALLRNVELTGCPNCLITQETPERLSEHLKGYFDRILVDAPCSGSGMFRRDPAAMDSWLAYGSPHCINLQQDILRSAWPMLKPGGYLVYSTCTFSIAENEAMIVWLMEQFADCLIKPITKPVGVSDGLPLRPELLGTARIWPHLTMGDGHFCALLQKTPENGSPPPQQVGQALTSQPESAVSSAAWTAFWEFCLLNLSDTGVDRLQKLSQQGIRRYEYNCLHILPEQARNYEKFKKVKTGLFLGQIRTLRDGRYLYEPSPAFLLSLDAADLRYVVGGSSTSDLIRRYLRGETISLPHPASVPPGRYVAITLTGQNGIETSWPLGWAKCQTPTQLKNLYPQTWRRLI